MADDTGAARRSGNRNGPGRPGGPRALLLLAMVVGLAVTALSLNAADSSGGDGSGVLDGVGPLHGEWLLVLLAVAAGGWYLVAKYYARQNERPMGTAREGRLVTLTVTAVVLTVLGTAVALVLVGMAKTDPAPPPPAAPPAPMPTMKARPVTETGSGNGSNFHMPHPISLPYLLLGLLVLASAALLVLVVVLARRYLGRGPGVPSELVGTLEPAPEEQALSAAVSAGRLALQGEDVRAAVIACYAAMEDSLAESGLGRRASDSPADLLRRAAEAGLLVGPAPQQLADLFRVARYSSHPMSRAELDRARSALDAIGTLLAGRRAALAAEREAAAAAEGSEASEVSAR
ncbi:DUF4129 domain-containing protein [Streptacidiphilus sp. N1-3]|uniref:DUF4129 domain-containing protein n=1 Tax=Streptacidiphilus alkalitolerans TaxID=3342712 RepID=A0ABV6WUV6_9ACTN